MPRKSTPAPAPGTKTGKAPARAKVAPAATAAPKPAAEGERIAKVLSRAGVSSRREAERLIEAGLVKVNGRVIDSPALNVTRRDRITVDGKPLAEPEPARLWLYYKPEGLVTSNADEKGRATVFDSLPEDMPRVMSVGRLDLNSEGLLLLTNDGELKRRLELPSTGWLRKYRVRVKGNPTDPDLEPLRKGIVADGERFQPMQVTLDRVQGANAWLTVGLREGKNREIRRAMTEIGLTVNRLIRISYGPFRLNDLQPGEVEEVRPRVLRDQLGLSPDDHEAEAPARSPRARPAPRPAAKAEAPRAPSRSRTRPAGRDDADPSPPRGRSTKTAAAAKPRLTPALRELSDSWTQAITPRKGRAPRPDSTATEDPARKKPAAAPKGKARPGPANPATGTAARPAAKPAAKSAPRSGAKPSPRAPGKAPTGGKRPPRKGE